MASTLLNWIEILILPPGITFVLLLIAALLSKRLPLLSFFLGLSSLLLLFVFSMPLTARYMLNSLQTHPAIQIADLSKGEADTAIVILGGGRYAAAPEYGYRDEISSMTIGRLRYAAELAKRLQLPILLSGGRRNSEATSEAVIMNQLMVDLFQIHTQFLEINGNNTHQQAIEVNKMLMDKGIRTIYLVTHAWHMQRAVKEFSLQGLTVKAAPMGFAATAQPENEYLPSASALASSTRALHEYYGMLYLSITE